MRGPAVRFGLAVLMVAIATGINFKVQALSGGRIPFLVYFPALIAVAYYCGLRPAALALAFASLAVNFFWMVPYYGFGITAPSDILTLCLFLVAGAVAIAISGIARGTVENLKSTRARLEEAHSAAAAAEQRFRIALQGSAILAWACDEQRRYTWVYNPAADLKAEDFIGKPLNSLLPRETFEDYAAAIDRVWQTGRAERLPVTWTYQDKARHYISSIDPVKNEDGAVVGLVGASVDVTALHTAQQDALNARMELQSVIDVMAAGVCRCSRDMRYLWASRRYLELFGYSNETVIGRAIQEVIGGALFEVKRPYIERVLAGESVEFEQDAPLPNGSHRWVHAAYTPTRNAAGAVDGWVAVVTDRTEAHAIQESLEQSEERLRLAMEGARIGLWSTDLATGLTHATPLNNELFGLAPDTPPMGASEWYALIHPEDREAVRLAWETAVAKGAPYALEYRVIRPDGVVRWILARARFHPDINGKRKRVIGISMDVTERKAADEALRDASRRKDEFLATLAHELRNPLAPIRYASRLFKADTPPEVIENLGEMVERQLAHLSRLLDDLLDVSRFTRGDLKLHREVLDMRTVIGLAVESVMPLAKKSGHTLDVHLPESPLPILGDSARLQQLLGNLLSNAVKYTESKGRIQIDAFVKDSEVLAEISDNGLGIASEFLPRIFELFTREDRKRAANGLGIGLAIAKQVAMMHGGQLEAHSAGRGLGARFVLRLPRTGEIPAISESIAVPEHVAIMGAAGTRVLVVDDNRDAADSLVRLLESTGFSTKVAYDGTTGIEIAGTWQPDIALLDLGLPDVSGHEVARRIRGEPWGSGMKLIAITGWGQLEDRRMSRSVGFDEHWTKPVSPEALLQLLAQLTRERAPSSTSIPSCADERPS